MNDAVFEGDVRLMLAARDPGPAAPGLAARIREERAAQRRASRPRQLLLASVATAVAAAAAVVVVAAALMARSAITSPGAMPSTAPVVGPAAVPVGVGVASQAGPPILPILLVVVVLLWLGFVAWRTSRKQVAVGALLAVVAVVAGVVIFALAQPLGRRGGASGAQPVAVSADGSSLVVLGGGEFWVETTLTNVSMLPLTIVGLDPHAASDGPRTHGAAPAGFVGIGLIGATFGPEGAVPFHPVELVPGASVDVVYRGFAGGCALSSIPPSIPPDGESSITFTSVDLQVDQLGVIRTVSMPLDRPIEIEQRPGCS